MNYLIHHSIEKSSDRFPDHEAFCCGSRSITYRNLLERMLQLAGLLMNLGVQKGDRVGIFMNRSLESAFAVYGILKAGAAYVPLDPHAPPERTRFLLRDCGIKQLISIPNQKRALKEVLAEETGLQTIIGIEGDWSIKNVSWDDLAHLPAELPKPVKILEDDLAYIMYTSGSTGVPKGIMHSHRSGLAYAKLSASLYGLGREDRIGNHAPLHFDISTLGYFTGPLVGATTVIIPDAYTKMPASLAQLMEKERISVWYSVPLALVQLFTRGNLETKDLSSLRWVLFGGEPFPIKYLRALMGQWPQAIFSNVYGPAEVNQCTYFHLTSAPGKDEPLPLGQVWENTEMLILGENGEEVREGKTGELLIRSATMMMAYWKQADLTEKSLYRKFSQAGFEKIYYRTGDLVKMNEKGHLMFLGRKDRQIKIRGHRVELEEIEAALLLQEEIEEAATICVQDKNLDSHLAAVVILKKDATANTVDIKAQLERKLPAYAIPQKIHLVDSLPRTPTGKIDRPTLKKQSVFNNQQLAIET